MPYSIAGKNAMLDELGDNQISHASIHDDIPDDAGSNEIAGGAPAYARQLIAFDPAAGGVKVKDAVDPQFDIPPATTAFYIGFWDALTVGTFLGYAPINGGAVDGVGSADDVSDEITAPGHTLVNDDRVTFKGPVGESLPAGIVATILYHVIGVSGDIFQVSLTQGGGVVNITAAGQVYFQKVIPETFNSQGILSIDTGSLKAED